MKEWKGAEDHYANFIKAVRSRKTADLHADILEGHLSSALCHTGNLSYRLGQPSSPEQIREALQDNTGLNEAFGRMTEHLAANGVDLTQDKLTPDLLTHTPMIFRDISRICSFFCQSSLL
jgi:hypothetical protein